MSTKKKDTFSLGNLPDDLMDVGRDLWLAGLGAVATVEKEGTELVKQGDKLIENLQQEANSLFKNLVKRGEKMEKKGRNQLTGFVEDVEAQQRKVTKQVEDVVAEAVEKALGTMDMPTRTEVMGLTKKVEKLTKQVDALAAGLQGGEEAPAAPVVVRTVYKVVAHTEGWAVIKEGNERATSVHETKVAAVDAGKELAHKHEPSELVIYRKNGTVQDTKVFG